MIIKSIKKRVLHFLLLVSIVPLSIFSIFMMYKSFDVQSEQVKIIQKQKSTKATFLIKNYFYNLENEINTILTLTTFRDLQQEEKIKLLEKVILKDNQFERFTLTDNKGGELFFVDRIEPFTKKYSLIHPNKELTDRVALTKESSYGFVYLDKNNFEPIIELATPIIDPKTNNLLNILVAEIRFKKVWEVVANLSKQEEDEIFVVDKNSRIVAHKSPTNVIKEVTVTNPYHSGILEEKDRWLFREYVVFLLGDQNFSVIAQRDLSKAYSFTIDTLIYASVLMVLLLGFILFILRVFDNTVTKRVIELAEGVKTIEDGNTTYRLKTDGSDEISHLANAVNNFVESLNRSVHDLQEEMKGRKKAQIELKVLNESLTHLVDERTEELQASNDELEETIDYLERTQKQLVFSEKMASLGSLVAGVAHEINTPIGMTLTAMSHLRDEERKIQDLYKKDELSEEDFQNFLDTHAELSSVVLSNITKAAELIKNFKLIAVDQSNEEKREFELAHYIEQILSSLHLELKRKAVEVEIKKDAKLQLHTYAGAISQIVTNLVMNSLIHGFKESKKKPKISFEIKQDGHFKELIYRDNGVGINPQDLEKIFEPFFTTNRTSGGSGLGLNIVYNIVKKKLDGDISCKSTEGEGVEFKITL